jgi:hypothetical protein
MRTNKKPKEMYVCIHSICMMLDEIYKDRKEKVIKVYRSSNLTQHTDYIQQQKERHNEHQNQRA